MHRGRGWRTCARGAGARAPDTVFFIFDLLTGDASYGFVGATVQRSHRFPMDMFLKIENMAKMGGLPVSLIINQLLVCGLDAVLKELPEEAAAQMKMFTPEQLSREAVTDRVEAK